MLIRKLFRTAWSYKAQFISMIIMIAIGIGVFLGFNIEWQSIKTNADNFFSATNYADFRLYSEEGFSEEDIEAVKNIDGVDAATRYLAVNVSIKGSSDSLSLNVSENYNVSTAYVTEGAEYDETSDGIWLSDKFAAANDISIGDTLTLTYQSTEITGEVVGLIKSSENLTCVADESQIMPDYETFGFAYISPEKLEDSLGFSFYSQINLISDMDKEDLEEAVKDALNKTILVTPKEDHTSYAGVESEIEEGEFMGSILPVLFFAIAILAMVTTMHRIAANEKVQIGTLKALGFRDRRILRHYTAYGLFIGILGAAIGVGLGYLVAYVIINPSGAMSTYFDFPAWNLYMPSFCIPVVIFAILFLTLISFLSVKRMLKGTAADALRPYVPKAMRKSAFEKLPFWNRRFFGTKWNMRDLLRHKSRSIMTLVGIVGCMILLVGGLGMKDTMDKFMDLLENDVSNYTTKVILTETAGNDEAEELCESIGGDWQYTSGISYEGKTISLEIYDADNGLIRFPDESNEIT